MSIVQRPSTICFEQHLLNKPLVKSAYQKNNLLISQPKHMLWELKRDSSFERSKHMLKNTGKKIFTILR